MISNKDRLPRFGSESVSSPCERFGAEVVTVNAWEGSSVEEELVQDVIEMVAVFPARLYGSFSHKNLKVMEKLRPVAAGVAG